jgi:hypothetical protein
MDANQFGWLYLIEHGKAGVEKCFYGGTEVVDKQARSIKCEWGDNEPIRKVYLANIRAKGVNWGETLEPESDMISQFTDTFHDATQEEIIKGTLVLYGGEKQTWFADAMPVQNIFKLLASASKAEAKFIEIFGCPP